MAQRLPAAQRRQQLLEVAAEIFGRGGYDQASMADIAAAAGVTKPVLYQHFSSKRALFMEVLGECGRRMGAEIEKATAEAQGPREQVERGFASFVRFFEHHPAMFRVIFSDANRADPEFAAEVNRVEQVVAERIAALIDIDDLSGDDRRLLAVGIVGLGEAACRHWMGGESGLSADRTAALLAAFAWTGLRGSSRS